MLIGVVGKPNCGKSTLFKALTLAEVEIANYPFATIKPNHGVGYVKVECADKDFNVQCNPREGYCMNHIRFVPVQLMDVAGLVPGAYEGKGMGNQFLDDLRQADALIHVIDVSGGTNDKGEPVGAGSYDPAHDIRFLETELDMWYLGILKKPWDRFARQVQMEHSEVAKAIAKQFSGLGVTEEMTEEVIRETGVDPIKVAEWTDGQLRQVAVAFRRRTKPMLIAANKVDVSNAAETLERLKKEFPQYTIIGCSAESELALKEAAKHGLIDYVPGSGSFTLKDEGKLSDKQKHALDFIKSHLLDSLGSTGVQQVIDEAVFGLLRYVAVFPGGVNKLEDQHGNVLPDCFLMPPGSTALDFAFRLHTDFGKNFIKAINVKTKLPMAKDHVLENRDVVEIMSGK